MSSNSDNGLHLVLSALDDIRLTQLDQARDIGAMTASLDSLAGPSGRVTHLEQTNVRQWWLLSAIAPFLFVTHAIARKLGVNV